MQTPPQAPAPAARPQIVITNPSGAAPFSISTPMSSRDLAALKQRRSELSNQLESVDDRRSTLLRQLNQTHDEVAVKGLNNRLALLDQRQLQLESDLATTGQQLSSMPAGLTQSRGDPETADLGSGQIVAISVVGMIFVLAPLAFGVMKSLLRRASRPGVPPAALTETAQRLERLESAVDTIAVEIERISEGQRFVTKLLSEGQTPSLGAGQRTKDAVR